MNYNTLYPPQHYCVETPDTIYIVSSATGEEPVSWGKIKARSLAQKENYDIDISMYYATEKQIREDIKEEPTRSILWVLTETWELV